MISNMVVTVDLCMYYYLFKGHEKYYKHIVLKTAGSEYTYIFNFASFRDYHFNKNLKRKKRNSSN